MFFFRCCSCQYRKTSGCERYVGLCNSSTCRVISNAVVDSCIVCIVTDDIKHARIAYYAPIFSDVMRLFFQQRINYGNCQSHFWFHIHIMSSSDSVWSCIDPCMLFYMQTTQPTLHHSNHLKHPNRLLLFGPWKTIWHEKNQLATSQSDQRDAHQCRCEYVATKTNNKTKQLRT